MTLVRDEEGRVLEKTVTMELEPDGLEAFDARLEPFALSWAMLGARLNESFPGLKAWPWAVVGFQREFRLMGHACSLRKRPTDFSLSSYSISGATDPLRHGVPPLSLVFVRRKEVLEDLAARSLLFDAAWSLLKEAEEKMRWLVLPDNPPEDWVTRTSVGDDALFRQVLGEAQGP